QKSTASTPSASQVISHKAEDSNPIPPPPNVVENFCGEYNQSFLGRVTWVFSQTVTFPIVMVGIAIPGAIINNEPGNIEQIPGLSQTDSYYLAHPKVWELADQAVVTPVYSIISIPLLPLYFIYRSIADF
ncbi:MAG: hypothetical protein RRY34_09285, partial [Victivallaceae bacterium]